MFNGIRPKHTNKQFNSAYLQIKFLISRKIHSHTFWLDKTFRKNRFYENKKIVVRFSIGDPPRQARQAKKQVAHEKSLRLHTRGGLAEAAEAVDKYFTKKKFMI